jgi:hypothetical protein
VRGVALAASALCVAGFCIMLWLSSYTRLMESGVDAGVEVMLARRPPAPERRERQPRPVAAPSSRAAPAAPSIEAEMLSRMLRCFDRLNRENRADCPREPPPPDWQQGSEHRFTPGGDFAGEEPLDLNDAYTPAERRTLVMPRCQAQVCIPIGPTPPPPTRSPEEICERGGLGGPCTAPPFRPEDVRRE